MQRRGTLDSENGGDMPQLMAGMAIPFGRHFSKAGGHNPYAANVLWIAGF
jgi:hypothetical protein